VTWIPGPPTAASVSCAPCHPGGADLLLLYPAETRSHPAPLPAVPCFTGSTKSSAKCARIREQGSRKKNIGARGDPEAMIVDGMKADSHEWNSGLGRPGHDNRARGAFPGERRRLYLTFFLFLPSWPHTHKKRPKMQCENVLRR
jgi:hypothetical protein